jgi:hypothetical protein
VDIGLRADPDTDPADARLPGDPAQDVPDHRTANRWRKPDPIRPGRVDPRPSAAAYALAAGAGASISLVRSRVTLTAARLK